MALTRMEEILTDGLQLFPMTNGNRALVFMQMETEEQQREMVHYLSGNAWDTKQEPLQGVVVFDAGKIRELFRCAVFKKIV